MFVSNGISREDQEYLALGGYGFLLGDGCLNYGRENIVETYYTQHAWRGFYPGRRIPIYRSSRTQPRSRPGSRANAKIAFGVLSGWDFLYPARMSNTLMVCRLSAGALRGSRPIHHTFIRN